MKKLAIALLFAILTVALARPTMNDNDFDHAVAGAASSYAAQDTSNYGLAFAAPTISDNDFDYFEAEDASYYTLAIVDGGLEVTLSHNNTKGSIAHVFAEIEREPKNELARIFAAAVRLDEADDIAEDRAVVTGNLRELAGMNDLGSGWAVLHDEIDLDAAIAAYTNWFTSAGLAVTADTGTDNVRPYNVTGDTLNSDLRVVFARKGSGVRVYIGEL